MVHLLLEVNRCFGIYKQLLVVGEAASHQVVELILLAILDRALHVLTAVLL